MKRIMGETVNKQSQWDFRNPAVAEGGYIFSINKPPGWTSYDVVRQVKKITGIKKVGHAGTLDPFATGVLLICMGKATKISGQLMQLPKQYHALLQLGQATDTLDRTGNVTEQRSVPPLTENVVTEALAKFAGKIRQQIPDYSAAKINGKRRYKLARQGKEIPARFKTVEIYKLELVEMELDSIRFRVGCSRGTYVRVLGADIARQVGTVGHLKELIRTGVGDYALENALSLLQFEQEWKKIVDNENISQTC